MQEKESGAEDKVIRLDYTIQDPAERVELVKKIVENTPQEKLTNKYL